MGDMEQSRLETLFWEFDLMSRVRARGRSPRARTLTKYIWVSTEGQVTELSYINSVFPNKDEKSATVRVLPSKSGKNSPKDVFKRILEKKKDTRGSSDEYWFVCDVDNWSEPDLQKILRECTKHNINIAVSNICFEFWLLLHKENPSIPGAATANDYTDKVKEILPNFSKSYTDFSPLKDKVDDAIKYCERNSFTNFDLRKVNSTGFYLLAKRLSKL